MRRIDRLTAARAAARFSTTGLSVVGLPTPPPSTPPRIVPTTLIPPPPGPPPAAFAPTVPAPAVPAPAVPAPAAPVPAVPVPVGSGPVAFRPAVVSSVDQGRKRDKADVAGVRSSLINGGRGAGGVERVLAVPVELRALMPAGGLRRGATVAVRSMSVVLALLSAASRAGSWCGVVGLPALNPVAAAEMGIALDRLALVPYPGTEWTTAVAALLDGLDIVVAAPPGPIAPVVANRLAARARQRGSVLMPAGAWAGADLTVEAVESRWEGLGAGRGRLRGRQLTVRAHGRGAASVPRQVTVWLPAFDRHGFGKAAPYAPEAVGGVPVAAEVTPLRRVG